MADTIHKESREQEGLSFFDYAMEVVGWLQIAASLLFSGLIVGGIVYLLIGNRGGLVVAICIVASAFVVGVVLANKAWKKKGTMNFVSRVNASPELDRLEQAGYSKRHITEVPQNGS